MEMIVSIWLVVNILGMFVASWGVWDALQDLKALGDSGNGRRIAARGTMRAQSFRFTKFAIFTVVGIAYLADVEQARQIARLGLLAVALLMLTDSSLDWRSRRKLWRQIETHNAQPHPDR